MKLLTLRKTVVKYSIGLIILILTSCGSGNDLTVVNNPKSPSSMLVSNSGGAALKGVVANLFSNDENSALKFELIRSAIAQTSSGLPFVINTCQLEGELDFIDSLQGDTGTFGSSSDSVSLVDDSHYCLNPEGDESSDFNSFNAQLFATYSVDTSDTSCFEGETLYSQFLIRSSGAAIYQASSNQGEQKLVLRGSFLFADPSDSDFTLARTLNCSLVIDSTGQVISAESSCSSSDGNVSLSSSGRECNSTSL